MTLAFIIVSVLCVLWLTLALCRGAGQADAASAAMWEELRRNGFGIGRHEE